MEIFKAILLGLIALAFGLNRLARAPPHVARLQVFRFPVRQMSEEKEPGADDPRIDWRDWKL